MRIVLATPLYPPDVEDLAQYVKELAQRLSTKHMITIITYGYMPEKIPNVKIITVNKHNVLPLRLIAYTASLLHETCNTDIIYAQNGPSTELPVGLVALVSNTPLIMHIGDQIAHKRISNNMFKQIIEKFAFHKAKTIITDSPIKLPEIIPFEDKSLIAQNLYNISWKKHVSILERAFINYG